MSKASTVRAMTPRSQIASSKRGTAAMESSTGSLNRGSAGALSKTSGGSGGNISNKTPRTKGPKFLMCHICSRPFASASLPIHVPQCLDKWKAEQSKLPKHMRAAVEPTRDTRMDTLSPEEWNKIAQEGARMNMPGCSYCGRKFNPDRIGKHESVCIENKGRKATTATAGLDGGRSARSQANDSARRAQEHESMMKKGDNLMSASGLDRGSYKAVNPAKRPMKICTICKREFGSKSIGIHIPACAKKYVLEQQRSATTMPGVPQQRYTEEQLIKMATDAVAATESRPTTANPFDSVAVGGGTGSGQIPNEFVSPAEVDLRAQCPNCPRKFNPDRLPVHLRSCRPKA